MLMWLSAWLAEISGISAFNVTSYLTLRATLSLLTALLITLSLGPWFIRWLRAKKVGQAVRNDGPESHLSKEGTPTMGGGLMLVTLFITVMLWGNLTNHYVWLVLLVTMALGGLGWFDDWSKVVHRNPNGIKARSKMLVQSVVALSAGMFLLWTASDATQTTLFVPFFKDWLIPLGGIGFIVLTYLVIVGSSNAVNITDGLDGLAIVPIIMVVIGLGVFCYLSGHSVFANYLYIPYIPGVGELTIVLAAVIGAGLGFLWFNAHPAQVFMGDVGALSLGGLIGVTAVIVRQELVLFVMGGLFVAEAVSVMLQVGYFKWSKGKRIFKMAPLHHHFEMTGWSETQTVIRFWIISAVLLICALATLKLR